MSMQNIHAYLNPNPLEYNSMKIWLHLKQNDFMQAILYGIAIVNEVIWKNIIILLYIVTLKNQHNMPK